MTHAYHIRVRGHLAEDWSDWFAGLCVQPQQNGETELYGHLDQAALHGVLARIRDLNITLIAVSLRDEAGKHHQIPNKI